MRSWDQQPMGWQQTVMDYERLARGMPGTTTSIHYIGGAALGLGGGGGTGTVQVVRHGPPEYGVFKAGDVFRDGCGDYWTCVKAGSGRQCEWVCRPGDPPPWGPVFEAVTTLEAVPDRPVRDRHVPCSRQWIGWMFAVYVLLAVAVPPAGLWFGVAMACVLVRYPRT